MRNKVSRRRDIFFSFYFFLIKSYSVFCQKVAKVEHTICESRYSNKLKKHLDHFTKDFQLKENDLLKVFPVLGNFGGRWYTTWQLYSYML